MTKEEFITEMKSRLDELGGCGIISLYKQVFSIGDREEYLTTFYVDPEDRIWITQPLSLRRVRTTIKVSDVKEFRWGPYSFQENGTDVLYLICEDYSGLSITSKSIDYFTCGDIWNVFNATEYFEPEPYTDLDKKVRDVDSLRYYISVFKTHEKKHRRIPQFSMAVDMEYSEDDDETVVEIDHLYSDDNKFSFKLRFNHDIARVSSETHTYSPFGNNMLREIYYSAITKIAFLRSNHGLYIFDIQYRCNGESHYIQLGIRIEEAPGELTDVITSVKAIETKSIVSDMVDFIYKLDKDDMISRITKEADQLENEYYKNEYHEKMDTAVENYRYLKVEGIDDPARFIKYAPQILLSPLSCTVNTFTNIDIEMLNEEPERIAELL